VVFGRIRNKVADFCLSAPFVRRIYPAIPQIIAIPTPVKVPPFLNFLPKYSWLQKTLALVKESEKHQSQLWAATMKKNRPIRNS